MNVWASSRLQQSVVVEDLWDHPHGLPVPTEPDRTESNPAPERSA